MKIKETVAVIAIGVLFALFIGLLVDAVYEEPKYENYCKESRYSSKPYYAEPLYNQSCKPIRDENMDKCYQDGGMPIFDYDQNNCQIYKECDFCNKYYQEAVKIYNRNIFFIIAPLAIIAMIVGLMIAMQYVGSGLILGGILLLIYSTARYFSDMSKLLRVIVIFIELAIVVFLTIKKLEKRK